MLSITPENPLLQTYYSLRGSLDSLLIGESIRDIIIVGVTGSKGKSTTAALIEAGLRDAGHSVALFTSDQKMINGSPVSGEMTQLRNFFSATKSAKCHYLIISVSYLDILRRRLSRMRYDAAILTNILSPEGSYTKGVEKYGNAFLRVFQGLYQYGGSRSVRKVSVVNQDSDGAQMFLSKDIVTDSLYTYGLSSIAQIRADNIRETLSTLEFDIIIPSNQFHISTTLRGKANIANILAATSYLLSQQVSITQIQESIRKFSGLPGRFEMIQTKRCGGIYLDRADNLTSLEQVFESISAIESRGRIITLFGVDESCSGESLDRISMCLDTNSDIIILSETIRHEQFISRELLQSSSRINRREGKDFWIIPTREDAIRTALIMLQPHDILLICGSGDREDRARVEKILSEIENQSIR